MKQRLYEIIGSHCTFNSEDSIDNSNFEGRHKELENLSRYCIDTWNNIIYAWDKVDNKGSERIDPRFYFQSIIFNLYILGAITKTIESNILSDSIVLKDLRDNIAHIDERLKKPLNYINIDEVHKNAVIKKNGQTIRGESLCGLNIDLANLLVASPLGIIGNTIFSTLKPHKKKSSYNIFVSYDVTEIGLEEIQSKLFELLDKYFVEVIVKTL